MQIGSVNFTPVAVDVAYADSVALDSFGRLRVSSPTTLFDAQQEYGLDTLRVWDGTANGTYTSASTDGSASSGGNAVGPTDASTRLTPITCSGTDTHYSILQSRRYARYIPGKGQLILMTGIFAPAASSTMSLVRRTSTSGSAVDTEIAQASWNIDKFDGTGVSGITLDFTKTQILVIQAQWLGVGRVIVGFDVNGVIYPAHQFLHANILTVPYTQTFNLPVRYEIRQETTNNVARCGYFDHANGIFLKASKVQSGGTIQMVCCSVQSEGGIEDRGFPRTQGSLTAIGVTTRRAVLSIRPKATFNSRTNRAAIELSNFALTAATNSSYFEIVLGGALGGVPAWTSVATDSVVEYDVAGTTVTGGTVVEAGFVLSGLGSTRAQTSGQVSTRAPFVLSQIDALAARQDSISIVCTSFTGTSSITSAINWFEQTV